jgi:hypothetical protein
MARFSIQFACGMNIYLLFAGRSIPVWVYGFIAAMIGFGIYSTLKKIRKQITPQA